ncbi:MAG: PQQ-binding-like beta-propeller repeat protein [Lewinellaceae bacterium]|nr:PQQ-binding-like beta-propeller repeat protein [Lewinellaceae bacterium]
MWRANLVAPDQPINAMTYPIIQSDKAFVIQTNHNAASTYSALNLNDGSVAWTHATATDDQPPYYNLDGISTKGLLCLPVNSSVKVLDWDTGRGKWHFTPQGSPVQYLALYRDHYLLQTSNDWQARKTHLYQYDLKSGATKLCWSIPWPDSTQLLGYTPLPLAEEGLALFVATARHARSRHTHSFWQVVDVGRGRVVRTGKIYPDNTAGHGPTKQPIRCGDDVLVVAYDQIFRLDPRTGAEHWRLTLPRDMLTSRPLLDGNALYCAMEDAVLYKIDATTGQVLWKTAISGTPSRMAICGHHLFVIGGGDGMLYTIDTTDGRLVRKMQAPNHDYRRDEFFQRFIGVNCRQNRLLLFDGRNFRAYTPYESSQHPN